ncbi:MAG TPA: hypothetical protein PLY70_06220 [Saprospiraceae bacterium]|nr:hypothetical protein [Saprospiraceae bacterium]HPN68887.1 hypothetical protein [Saprospiraceae bacterium]
MGKFFAIIGVLLFPLCVLGAISGAYQTNDRRIQMDIIVRGNKLYVYDKNYGEKYQYHRINHKSYRTHDGDLIKWVSDETILFTPAFGSTVYTLNRKRHTQPSRNGKDYQNDLDNNIDPKNEQYGSSGATDLNKPIDPNFKDNGSLEGTWRSTNPTKSVVILLTRDGLKAKFSGTTNWISYTQQDSSKTYIDKNGNHYDFHSAGVGNWIHSNGVHKVNIVKFTNDLLF